MTPATCSVAAGRSVSSRRHWQRRRRCFRSLGRKSGWPRRRADALPVQCRASTIEPQVSTRCAGEASASLWLRSCTTRRPIGITFVP
jgi:hypothetical protein